MVDMVKPGAGTYPHAIASGGLQVPPLFTTLADIALVDLNRFRMPCIRDFTEGHLD
jgi:hypothetical protein